MTRETRPKRMPGKEKQGNKRIKMKMKRGEEIRQKTVDLVEEIEKKIYTKKH